MEEKISAPLPKSANLKKRPTIITVICVLALALGIPGSLIGIVMMMAAKAPDWQIYANLAATVIGLACFIGMLLMKRWAVILYTVLFLAGQGIGIATHTTTFLSVFGPLIVIFIGYAYFNRMD